ncbi:MAG: hypothetical protein ICV66_12860, partial [Chitinophagaceae bacterium]|nr:hypothetical protein [Chitinophagaceae bacterium]
VACKVLSEREALCDGYARLFKTLCEYSGIHSEIVRGYVRSSIGKMGENFHTNHSWNAVLIDSTWHLLDATWAAGYINYANEFVRKYDGYYFLTSPQQFIGDHFPENLQWALLDNPPLLSEFKHAPFKHSAYNKYKIVSYKPAHGIIEASVGDSIELSLETIDEKKDMFISGVARIDSNNLYIPDNFIPASPKGKVTGKKISCTYVVASDSLQWLNVIYNNYVIMQYRLNIKKNITQENTPGVVLRKEED